VWVRSSPEYDSFWGEGIAAHLTPQAKVINRLLSELAEDIKYQSGQPVGKGVHPSTENIGRAALIKLEQGSDSSFERVGSGGNIAGMYEAIQRLLDWWALSLNLPQGFMQVQATSNTSGIAIIASQLNLQTDFEQRKIIFTVAEREVVELAGYVWSRHQPGMPMTADGFQVTFPDHGKTVLTTDQNIAMWDFQLNNAKTHKREQVLQEMEPSLTPLEAKLRIAAIDSEDNAPAQAEAPGLIQGADGVPTRPARRQTSSRRNHPPTGEPKDSEATQS
jgi:hypothetical protein